MHILVAILTALGGAAFLLYRLYWGYRTAREIGEAVGDAGKAIRKARWKHKSRHKDPLYALDDPREAATILMLAVGRADGPLSDGARDAILARMTGELQMSQAEASDMLSYLAWATQDITDYHSKMRRIVAPILNSCNAEECGDLIRMLETVAATGLGKSPIKQQIINRYDQVLREGGWSPSARPGHA